MSEPGEELFDTWLAQILACHDTYTNMSQLLLDASAVGSLVGDEVQLYADAIRFAAMTYAIENMQFEATAAAAAAETGATRAAIAEHTHRAVKEETRVAFRTVFDGHAKGTETSRWQLDSESELVFMKRLADMMAVAGVANGAKRGISGWAKDHREANKRSKTAACKSPPSLKEPAEEPAQS